MKLRSWVGLLALSLVPGGLAGQETLNEARGGFFVSIGVGAGILGFTGIGPAPSFWGATAGIRLGGSISERWLIGVESHAWTNSGGDSGATLNNLSGILVFVPSVDSGLIVKGAAGLARLGLVDEGTRLAGPNGLGLGLGVGYGFHLWRGLTLEPYSGVNLSLYEDGQAWLWEIRLDLVRY